MYKRLVLDVRDDGDIRAKMKTTITNWAYGIDQEHVVIFNFLSNAHNPLRLMREGNCVIVTWVLPGSLKDFLFEKFKGCELVDINF